jgi:hypothetical protein
MMWGGFELGKRYGAAFLEKACCGVGDSRLLTTVVFLVLAAVQLM